MKYLVFLLILMLQVFPQTSIAQQHNSPFTSTTTTNNPAKIINVNASIAGNKIILDWIVTDNQTADLFEIEKSTDGKNFSIAALAFGSDKPETGNYQFFEKAVACQSVSYRIKLVNKNKNAEYSITVQVNTPQPLQ